jgi:hypothetical protein
MYGYAAASARGRICPLMGADGSLHLRIVSISHSLQLEKAKLLPG